MLAEPAPSASVVIPVKDGARWLGEVLAAGLAQALGLEVLVIDSGSRDHFPDGLDDSAFLSKVNASYKRAC